jgi:hypothetical protein
MDTGKISRFKDFSSLRVKTEGNLPKRWSIKKVQEVVQSASNYMIRIVKELVLDQGSDARISIYLTSLTLCTFNI